MHDKYPYNCMYVYGNKWKLVLLSFTMDSPSHPLLCARIRSKMWREEKLLTKNS